MKLLSVLLLFATTWLMAIAWRKDLNDILFQEYLENENQGEFKCMFSNIVLEITKSMF